MTCKNIQALSYSFQILKRILSRNHDIDGKHFQCRKGDTDTNSKLNYMFLLTEGVVDDLKQSKVAGRYTVHAELHNHSLKGRTRTRRGEKRKHRRDDYNKIRITMINIHSGLCTRLPGRPGL